MNFQTSRTNMAMTVAFSWLKAVGIPVRPSGKTGQMVVNRKDGREMGVAIVDENAPSATTTPQTDLRISVRDIGSARRETALREFHKITEAAGYGSPIPVDRGEAPKKRVYGDDFFLRVSRHQEFRQAPNPTNEQVARYKPILDRACKSFLSKNNKLCTMNGLELDDLNTYAMVWLCNFLHRMEIQGDSVETQQENARILTIQLRQRFFEMYQQLLASTRRCTPNADIARLALTGTVFHGGDFFAEAAIDPRHTAETTDKSYVALHAELDLSTKEKRRLTAKKLLEKKLNELPHDQLVATLTLVAKGIEVKDKKALRLGHSFDYGTRREAARRLREHNADCDICREHGSLSNEDEHVPAADAACAAE